MRALVTGVSGFVGGHLVEHLIAEGDLVVGLSASGQWPADLAHLGKAARIEAFDLVEQSEVALAELVRHERTVEIEMLGELALTSRSVIALDGTGTDFDQVYRVDAIERRLTPDRGMTQFVRATNSSPRTITATATSLPQ